MRVAETMPALTFPGREVMGRASRGEDILGQEGIWEGEKEEVWKGWEELVGLVGGSSVREGEEA